jgi:hypothetical protein
VREVFAARKEEYERLVETLVGIDRKRPKVITNIAVIEHIAVIEQAANEALSENRRELAEETAKIHTEADLSEEAKACYVGEARESAQAKYAESALLKTQDA